MKILKLSGHILIITVLTALTQVGGLIWLVSLIVSKQRTWKKRYIFPVTYLIFNLILIPPVASYFGREQLPWFNTHLAPRNWFYPLAFRNYVKPELKSILFESSKTSGIKITYLDANFPFIDKFPLLPHLSHNDGKKIDISFMYLDKNGKKTNKKPSTSGYGAYADSKNPTSNSCLNNGHWQYDFTKHITFGIDKELKLDKTSTKTLIKSLLSKAETQSIFVEPYLKQNLKLHNEYRIRFHGCQAVRHDDHIHLQIK